LIREGAERDTHWRILGAAHERGISLRIRFDASAGRLSNGGTHLEYPLCSIGTASGASFGDETRNCPPGNRTTEDSERLLALGVAQRIADPGLARRTLTEALASLPALAPGAQAIAYEGRARAAEALGYEAELSDRTDDQVWAAALADYRRQVSLAPADPDVQFSVARVLTSLGGYAEAMEVYRAIGRRWPEQAFEVAVRIGALYRQQGDHRRALRQLDDYARANPNATFGMKFHYHRAWTLSRLERFEEAEREIDSGLLSQPDYSAAFQLRSCARARLGRLDEALADQRRATELMAGIMAEPDAILRAEIARSHSVVAALERALQAGQRGPLTAPCDGFLDRWSRPRSRSPLLDRPASPG
jgi:tetratricopeptide (TPR) repeat protein